MSHLLIIGEACDGPVGQIVKFNTLERYQEVFGGEVSETRTIGAGDTEVTLTHPPFLTIKSRRGSVVNYLHRPIVQPGSNIVEFSNPGLPSNQVINITYRPYLGKTDLLTAVNNYFLATGELPYVARIHADVATLSIQGWVFKTRNAKPSEHIKISKSGTVLAINVDSTNISITGTNNEIREKINEYYNNGTINLYCEASPATDTGWIPTALTGANTKSLNYTQKTFNSLQAVPFEVSHILYLDEISDDLLSQIEVFNLSAQPRVFLTNFTPISNNHVNELARLTTITNKVNAFVVCAYGSSTFILENGVSLERFSSEALAQATNFWSATNKPINRVTSFSPVLNEAELDYITNNGLTCLVRRIGNNVTPYRSTVTDTTSSYILSNIYARVWTCTKHLYQYIGKKMASGRSPQIEQKILEHINALVPEILPIFELTAVVIEDAQRNRKPGDEAPVIGSIIDIKLRCSLYGEVVDINFSITSEQLI